MSAARARVSASSLVRVYMCLCLFLHVSIFGINRTDHNKRQQSNRSTRMNGGKLIDNVLEHKSHDLQSKKVFLVSLPHHTLAIHIQLKLEFTFCTVFSFFFLRLYFSLLLQSVHIKCSSDAFYAHIFAIA